MLSSQEELAKKKAGLQVDLFKKHRIDFADNVINMGMKKWLEMQTLAADYLTLGSRGSSPGLLTVSGEVPSSA